LTSPKAKKRPRNIILPLPPTPGLGPHKKKITKYPPFVQKIFQWQGETKGDGGGEGMPNESTFVVLKEVSLHIGKDKVPKHRQERDRTDTDALRSKTGKKTEGRKRVASGIGIDADKWENWHTNNQGHMTAITA